jgi:ribosomal protein S18 acetylase RimI-like enzyme
MIHVIEGPSTGKAPLCEPILHTLHDWFGIEEDIGKYLAEIDQLPTFLAFGEDRVLGFLTLKQHFPHSAEILVMGCLPQVHRRGIGRALVGRAEAWLLDQGVDYLHVKTLGPSHPDPSYDTTRAFYQALGFEPLEEFKQIWDDNNPCLVMVKKLEL